MSKAFERVLERLDRVKTNRTDDVLAACPVASHGQGRGDRNPSLHVTDSGDRVLLDCKSGCDVQDVVLALGLDWPDLFDDVDERGHLVARYVYQRPDGTPYHVNERWQVKGGKRFVQRLPDAEKPGLGAGFKPSIYRLPKVLAAAKAGTVVYWVEGEKCVHAAESIGLTATCASNGVNGWRDYMAGWLAGASEVVVITDNDDAGRTYAANVVTQMRSAGLRARAVKVATEGPKDDLYDHVMAQFGEADLIPVNLTRQRPEGSTLGKVMATTYKPVRWVVDGVLAAGGVAILGGAPKIGKSYITLDIALGVAAGGMALSSLNCHPGSVLYVSVDNDSERRIQERTKFIWGGVVPELQHPIEVHTEWPTGIGALAACMEWANEADNPSLVVLDTYVRVEPNFEGDGRQNAYAASIEVLARWAKFAQDADVAVLAVHHDRKATKDEHDWLDRFMGSRGVTASAQALLMVDAKRGEDEGLLRISGRDIETDDLGLMRQGRLWTVTTPPRVRLHAVH